MSSLLQPVCLILVCERCTAKKAQIELSQTGRAILQELSTKLSKITEPGAGTLEIIELQLPHCKQDPVTAVMAASRDACEHGVRWHTGRPALLAASI